jgi:hypothetical protein
VLIEKDGFGHSENYLEVQVAGAQRGELAEVTVTEVRGAGLAGVTAG